VHFVGLFLSSLLKMHGKKKHAGVQMPLNKKEAYSSPSGNHECGVSTHPI